MSDLLDNGLFDIMMELFRLNTFCGEKGTMESKKITFTIIFWL